MGGRRGVCGIGEGCVGKERDVWGVGEGCVG